MYRLFHNSMKGIIASLCLTVGSGCAIHYYDPKTGTEHIWGIGHMKMKVASENEGLQAVVRGTNTVGLSVGMADNQNYISIGWQQLQGLTVVPRGSALRLEWPDSDFVNVRVGSQFPGITAAQELNTDKSPKETPP